MNELQVFKSFEFGEIRVLEKEGQPWFVGKDVAKILGYSNASKAVGVHVDDEDKAEFPIWDGSQNRNTYLINEGGLYSLILSSKLPNAKKFKRWVTSEVLPSIRKHGGYIRNQENISSEEILANAVLVAQNVIKEKDRLLEEQRPKVLFADAWEVSKKSILVGEMAKLLAKNGIEDMGQNRLFKWLRDNGYLHKTGEQYNLPTQRSIDLEIIEVKTRTIANTDGSVRVTKTSKITPKGQQYFINKFLNKGEIDNG